MTKETKIQLAVVLSTMAVATVGILVLRRFVGVRERVVKNTLKEYENWNYGKMNENSPEAIEHLRKYWKSVGVKNWSESRMRTTPWSAAFTSYILQKSGVRNFEPDMAHLRYINEAKDNKRGVKVLKPYNAFLKKGYLVCYSREGGSHCDIVTEIKNGKAYTIGGNVGDTVKKEEIYLTDDNRINQMRTTRPYIAVLKTN